MDREPRGLGIAAVLVVGAGGAAAVSWGIAEGIDAVGIVLLGAVVASGALVVAAVTRMRSGGVAPRRCSACGGLISPHSPYCKHCGERISV